MDDKSPEIDSDPDEFQSLEDYERSPEFSRSVEIGDMGNLEVNPPRPGDHSPADEEEEVNLDNFRVEFGGGTQQQPDPDSPPLVSDVEEERIEDNENMFDDEDVPSNLYLNVDVDDNEQLDEDVNQEEVEDIESAIVDINEEEREDDKSESNLEIENENVEDLSKQEPSSSSVPFHSGSLRDENVFDDEEVHDFALNLNLDNKELMEDVNQEEVEDVQDTSRLLTSDKSEEEREDEKKSERRETGRGRKDEKDLDVNLSSRSTSRKRGRPKFQLGGVSRDVPPNQSNDSSSDTKDTSLRTESETSNVTVTKKGGTEQGEETAVPVTQTVTSSGTSNVLVKSKRFMTPGAVIYNYERGRLSRREAFEILQEAKRSKMLHKSTDKVYIDKEGDVRIPRGYSFGRSRTSEGKVKRKHGLTRIDREIQAYQKSTHMLIPRAIFARIVREIAQGWFKGEGQIKFTIEALAALQAAAEDEMVRLLETSMVCSRHAKRITLRVEDVRLARFCRGRQLYEFNNMDL